METPEAKSQAAATVGLVVFVIASIAASIPAYSLSHYMFSLATESTNGIATSLGPPLAGVSSVFVSVVVGLVVTGFLHFTNQIFGVESPTKFGGFLGYCGYGRLFPLCASIVSLAVFKSKFTTKLPILDLTKQMSHEPALRILSIAGSALFLLWCLFINYRVKRAPLRALATQTVIMLAVGAAWFLLARPAA